VRNRVQNFAFKRNVRRYIAYLRSNPKAGFVQARWVYTNGGG
jgi:hypothetical protein